MSAATDFNKTIIEEFRANAGKVGGQFANVPMLLLHTVGAKSGQPRVNPLAYVEDGDRLVIVASFAGGPNNPPWYHNLLAQPEVGIEVGSEEFRASASVAEEPERTRLYEKVAAAMPVFTEYQSKTTRVIPVITLTRIR
jgi:deazaflavin-dependent oxidoreductase (nitroreductase family)